MHRAALTLTAEPMGNAHHTRVGGVKGLFLLLLPFYQSLRSLVGEPLPCRLVHAGAIMYMALARAYVACAPTAFQGIRKLFQLAFVCSELLWRGGRSKGEIRISKPTEKGMTPTSSRTNSTAAITPVGQSLRALRLAVEMETRQAGTKRGRSTFIGVWACWQALELAWKACATRRSAVLS